MHKNLILEVESKNFTNEKTGEVIKYNNFYVNVILGSTTLKIDLKPTSTLGKQILNDLIQDKEKESNK